MMLALSLARSAVSHSVGKALFAKMLKAGIIIRKLAVEILDCVPKMGRNRLAAVHDDQTLAKTERDVKG
jgi:hypothetical protein